MKTKLSKIGKGRILWLLISVLVFCLAASLSYAREKEVKVKPERITKTKKAEGKLQKITIAQFGHLFIYLPIYVAKEKGFFKEEGLDVTYVSTGGDEKTWAAVTSGSAQFGVADPTFVAIARERGDKSGRIIASIVDGVPFWGVSKKKIHIKKMNDFSNLRVATFPAPSTNYALMNRMIKEHRLNTRIVQGAFGTLLAIVEKDKADMAMELEPTTSLAVKQGYNVAFSYKDLYTEFAFTGLSTTYSYIKNSPDICQKVVMALQKAYRYVYQDFQGTVEAAQKEFPDYDRDVLEMGVKRIIADKTVPRSAIVKETSWNAAVGIRKYIGDLKGNAPFAENVDNQFADKPVKSLYQYEK